MDNHSFFLKYLEQLSITVPTQIQKLCFNPLYEGQSVFGLAPTGSGKTLAFVLPLLLRIVCEERKIQTVVLAPTRELGMQIAKVFEQVSKIIFALDKKNILISCAFGGSPISKQLIEIAKKPHILISTPGRLIDILERKLIDTKSIKTLVLDEADVMVGMGFDEQVEAIYQKLNKIVQVAFFSATQSEKVTNLEEILFLNKNRVVCDVSELALNENNKKFHDSDISHQFVFYNKHDKYTKLILFLRKFELNNTGKIIVFCQQKETVHTLTETLKNDGFIADSLTGDHGPVHRNSVMRNFKNGQLKYLISTNIAARGIDIDKLSAVIHFDTPLNREDYIHRTGRTGRSGYSEGIALTFVNDRTRSTYLKIMNELNITKNELKLTDNKTKTLKSNSHIDNAKKDVSLVNKVEFFKVHINRGKKNNIRPGDILGAFIKELKLTKEDLGSIFIFDNFTHVEVNIAKKRLVLNQSFKIKNLSVKVSQSK